MALIWYDTWQMECCGDPYAIGDEVAWSLSGRTDVDWLEVALGTELAAAVTHVEDHHEVEGDAVVRTGAVLDIRCVSCRYAPTPGEDQRVRHPVEGTTRTWPVQRADGSERSTDDRSFIGYLVDLDLRDP